MKRYPIAICMAGAVSAGAYTAGAMSVLLENLRLWESDDEDIKEALKGIAPKHRIIIKGMTGASAGSIQAILSSLDMFSSKPGSNLGSIAWLDVALEDLLDASDLKQKDVTVKSVLNTKALKNVIDDVKKGYSWGSERPSFLDENYEIRLSVTNLRGIPYNLKLPETNETNFGASQHNEYLRFRFVDDARDLEQSEKHYFIDIDPNRPPLIDLLMDGGLASSAFPFAFEPIKINRPTKKNGDQLIDAYDTKEWLAPLKVEANANETLVNFASIFQPPDWNISYGEKQTIYAVDGGATNNEPILEAFKLLSGDSISGWGNIQEEDEFDAANNKVIGGRVLFIDPFPNSLDKKIKEDSLRIDKQAAALKSALIGHARFSEPLIISKKLKNRVGLVYPSNPLRDPDGNKDLPEKDQMLAIKSGSMGGFAGFLKKDFLRHDYELGRLNMKRFLRYHFTVPIDHELVSDDQNYIEKWKTKKEDGSVHVPLIPVFSELSEGQYLIFESHDGSDENKKDYYRAKLDQFDKKFTSEDRKALHKGLIKRFEAVVSKLIRTHSASSKPRYPDKNISWVDRWIKRSKVGKGLSGLSVFVGWKVAGKGFLANAILETIENSLAAQNLLDYRVRDKDGNEIKYKGNQPKA